MKKLYYVLSIIVVPLLVLLLAFLDNANVLKASPFLLFNLLLLSSAVIANLTPTEKKFDGFITILMPLAFFVLMFFVGFFDATETYSRFTLRIAVKVATQPLALMAYLGMALTAFVFSYKNFRVRFIHKKGV